ncbi:MAG TPA: NAD(P)/FAD-dependent oxidoreductase [Jatrophihabitans sp.]|jgi:NADPH-dependent 2,4-dienoyl-CoA reductase/sulfur reductase-like enzyme|uniref:FAD/NAD(P)-dependent oxidoreductase n=1 Tax=Jatrophihabitans sp. TaxID=1932789 RepID=UPI002F0D8CF6
MTSPADTLAQPSVAVIGAGPAGLAAAVHAAEQGAATTLIDSAARLGGQYWRHDKAVLDGSVATSLRSSLVPRSMLAQPSGLHHDVATYHDLLRRLEDLVAARRLTVHLEHHVWSLQVEQSGCSIAAVDRRDPDRPGELRVRAAVVVLAVGAYDRQVPFPGWDLPGVLTVGGAQALLKGSGVTVGPRVLVAGTGPFLLPVATALAASGADVLGVHEANRNLGWLRRLPAAAPRPATLREAGGYALGLARHRIPLRTRSVVVAAHGADRLEAVTVARLDRAGGVRDRTRRRIAVDVLAVGYGFTTQSELPLQAGCALSATADGTLAVTTDSTQQTSDPRVYAAGETTGVGGAQLAVAEGVIAGFYAARAAGQCAVGQTTAAPARPDRVVETAIRTRDRLRRFAAAMHAVYPVPRFWLDTLEHDTVVCRCEEVTVAEVDAAIDNGARDARSVKLLSRSGMGWCQGRVCGYAISCLTASRTGQALDLASSANRPVAAPIPLGLLAQAPADRHGQDS